MPALYSHLYRVVQDLQGNVVSDVMGTVKLAGTGDLAVLYADAEGLSTLPNPLVNSAEYGSFSVYLDSGHYDMSFAKPSYVFEELVDLYVHEATGGVVSVTGTPNQVLVSAGFGDIVLSTPQNTDPDATLQFAHLGLGTPGVAGYGLKVETLSLFNATMSTKDITSIGQVTANIHWTPDHAGSNQVAFYTVLAATGGSNRWAIYAGGNAPSYLGGTLQVAGTTSLAAMNTTGSVGIGGSLSVTGTISGSSTLYVAGASGLAAAPVAGYAIYTGASTSLAANVTIGLGTSPATYTLDVNGSVRSRSTFYCDATGQFMGILTASGGVNTTALNASSVGVTGHTSSGTLGTNAFTCTTLYASSTLTVGGNTQLALTGCGTAPTAGYWLRSGRTWLDDLSLGGGNRGYTIDNYGTLYCGGAGLFAGNLQAAYLGVGIQANYEGYPFHCNGEAKFRASIRVDGTGYKPGGGSWADSSLRVLKRHIAPIPDALDLLLEQQGRMYEWAEPEHAKALPGVRYGLVREEVTIPQWHVGEDGLGIQGFEALCIEALRTIVQRLEALEGG